jgi:hypothetical protein
MWSPGFNCFLSILLENTPIFEVLCHYVCMLCKGEEWNWIEEKKENEDEYFACRPFTTILVLKFEAN